MVLDPGEKLCPFGSLNWRHSYARGIGQSAQGLSVLTTPSQNYRDNVTTRKGDIYFDAQGGITGRIMITMSGQAALRWRQVALRNDIDEVKKQFDRDLQQIVPDGVDAHVDHFLGMDSPSSLLMAVVDVKGTLGTATAKRRLIPGYFFETRGHVPFVKEEKRLEPVDMHYGEVVSDEITYHIPDGISVEGAPQDAKVSWAGHAMFVTQSKSSPGQILIADSLAEAYTLAKPEEYQDLRGFYQKVAVTDQEELVLTASPGGAPAQTGKGN
jgi:hypothetical protein